MNYTKLHHLLLVAGVAAAGACAPRAAQALAPGALASHHTQYYYSNFRAPCTTRGVAAVPGACAGTTVVSYRPVTASTTYAPRYAPLFGPLVAPWSRPMIAPLAPGAPTCGICQPACPPPQPECCNTLRIVVPDSPIRLPAEYESKKVPAQAEEQRPAADKKPADANPASAPRLTNPRDRLTMLPIQ